MMDDLEEKRLIVPSDYEAGYPKARAFDRDMADRYLAHTAIGDPLAEALVEDLRDFPRADAHLAIQAGMDGDVERLAGAPDSVREFFADATAPPPWLTYRAFNPGIRMFHRNSDLILAAMVGGVLVEGFSSNIAKSFYITGRLRDQGVRRLHQNNRHMLEIFLPQGLEHYGDGWKLSVRIRLVHARIRKLLEDSPDWNFGAWGTPISSAHLGLSISAFSARLLQHLAKLGVKYDEEERASFMAVWRYSGYLMGIPESILYRDEAEALKLFRIAHLCEPPPDLESVVMAHSLINSAPLILGIDEPTERRQMAEYAFGVSRALIGDELANQLRYPPKRFRGVLPIFRLRTWYRNVLRSVLPGFANDQDLTRFRDLLKISLHEDTGITYRLPDQVYSEEAIRW